MKPPASANFLDSRRALSCGNRICGQRRRRGGRGRGGEGSADLGPVDGVGGDELVDVGVGPLGEGLGAAVDLLEVVEEGEVARPVLLQALEVLTDPHRRRRRRFAGHLDSFRRRGGGVALLLRLVWGKKGGGRRHSVR